MIREWNTLRWKGARRNVSGRIQVGDASEYDIVLDGCEVKGLFHRNPSDTKSEVGGVNDTPVFVSSTVGISDWCWLFKSVEPTS